MQNKDADSKIGRLLGSSSLLLELEKLTFFISKLESRNLFTLKSPRIQKFISLSNFLLDKGADLAPNEKNVTIISIFIALKNESLFLHAKLKLLKRRHHISRF